MCAPQSEGMGAYAMYVCVRMFACVCNIGQSTAVRLIRNSLACKVNPIICLLLYAYHTGEKRSQKQADLT